MKLLLDTHALIWTLGQPDELSEDARVAVTRPGAVVATSMVSLWEIAAKHGLGRLDTSPAVVAAAVDDSGIDLVGLSVPDVVRYGSLPRHHRDPFDRMLVAQALVGGWVLVTRDARLTEYGVAVLAA